MSDEIEKTEGERANGGPAGAAASDGPGESASEVASAEAGEESAEVAKPAERLDADGLPLDREPTIDDVRSQTGLHGRIGVGCVMVIVLLVAGFWLLRAGIIG
jgi:hypothetical protein